MKPRVVLLAFIGVMLVVHAYVTYLYPLQADDWSHWVWHATFSKESTVGYLRAFFATHPQVSRVFTNGGTATRLYRRLVLPHLPTPWQALPLQPLPSTSPAHAAMRFEQKLAHWQAVAAALRDQ